MRVAFVCVQNAGRSQMAAAFARRERSARGLVSQVELLSGGTDPADAVHDVVVEAMAELDVDLADAEPGEISPENLAGCDIVITMGCSAEDVCPATWSGESRDWGLPDPHGEDLETVREIRQRCWEHVDDLFDEIEAETR